MDIPLLYEVGLRTKSRLANAWPHDDGIFSRPMRTLLIEKRGFENCTISHEKIGLASGTVKSGAGRYRVERGGLEKLDNLIKTPPCVVGCRPSGHFRVG